MSFLSKIIAFIKGIFSPKVKPIDASKLIEKPKLVPKPEVAKKEEVPAPEAAPVAVDETLLSHLKQLEAEKAEIEKERMRIKEALRKLDEDYANGILTAQQRDREFGALLRKGVNLRRKLAEIEQQLVELRRQIQSAA